MKFNYQARNKEGTIQKGVIEASSKEAALAILQKYGLYLTILEREKPAPIFARNIKFFSNVSQKDVVIFCRQLSIMFQSQVPIVESLAAIIRQSEKAELREKLLKIQEEVEGGAKLSSALSTYPSIFSPYFLSMIRSGEASGKLSEALEYLADHLEYEYNFKSKIRGAMIYPLLVVIVFIVVLIFLIYWVLPPLMSILAENGTELPWSTRAIMSFSNFIKGWGWIIVVGIAAISGLFYQYTRGKEGKYLFDKNIIKLPVIGDLLKKIYLARFAENLSTLIAGGLPIAKALEIGGEVVGNEVYKDIIFQTRDGVRKGESLSSILETHPEEFSPLFVQMVAVGEKTGRIDSSLQNVVNFYQKEVDRGIATLISLIEPAMIIVMGIGAAFLLVSIFLPIYQIGNF
ncbi:MAG: hypothetical protein A2175_01900 [Candidatus Nealsonbacteria bacterium RBG_13_42_11]|uniref:Type II secretion system protein GspF domain-containing protein n=1 Tax=Candidatus Nealsonbacteria bacterium RBG_13_42_11 TaxID=1801663 RepID=A0A1G2DZX1_9BACT|nr:MAG: hypothetical protein A2175_01900 [Candidatus Nealsonbacteria bacterium RBG_13_42_11]HJX32015.1 type II secretion system F family protein [Thermodesulfobacteriota bacterium]